MRYVHLSGGLQMPVLGIGTAHIEPGAIPAVLAEALEAGYRLIDTASAYGNEAAIGEAIASSGLPREELFLVTKIWIDEAGEDKAAKAIDASLARLRTDYVDLLLVHQPYSDYYGTWRAMQRAYDAGRARALGVSNFTSERLLELRHFARIPPAVNQLELHLYHQRAAECDVLKAFGVQLMAWAPLGKAINWMLSDERLAALAQELDRTPAQVALRYLVERGIVAIPRATRPEHIRENIGVFDFALTGEQMALLAGLDKDETVTSNPMSHEALAQFLRIRMP